MENINKKNKIVSLVMATLMIGSVLMPLTEIKVNAQTENPSSIGDPVKESTIETQKDPIYRVVTGDRPEKDFPIKDDSVEWTIDDFEISNGKIKSFSTQGYEKFNKNPENVVVKIPEKDKKGSPITTIGENAFLYGNYKFKHYIRFIDLPDTITNIKKGAFENQDLNFEEFTVPSTWVEIGKNAFYGAYFKELNLTNMNKESENIFWNGITTPYIEMNGMGEWQMNYNYDSYNGFFEKSNIKHINYGNSKIKLNRNSFSYVNNDKINKNKEYKTFKITWDGQKTEADFDVPDWETYIPFGSFSYCKSLQSVTFKNLKNFKFIENRAFKNCTSLHDIEFKDLPSLEHLGDQSFGNCTSLESVIFRNLLKFSELSDSYYKEEGVFQGCSSLKSVIFDDLPVFYNINCGAFYNCTSLQNVTLKNLPILEYINGSSFNQCISLHSVTLKNLPSLRVVGAYSFYGCTSLRNVTFEDLPALEYVDAGAFRDCKLLKNVIFKNLPKFSKIYGFISIDGGAFYGCDSLENVIFEYLPVFQYIGYGTFGNCTSLKNVVFNDSYISLIDEYAFDGASVENLEFIESEEKLDRPFSVGINAFRNCNISHLKLPKRYNKDGGSGFTNQKFTKTLKTSNFRNDPNFSLIKEGDKSYVTITNPVSIKHGNNLAYLKLAEPNSHIEIISGPNGEPNMLMKIKSNTNFGELYNVTFTNDILKIDDVAGKKDNIPFTCNVSFAIAFDELGETHLMAENWTHDSVEILEVPKYSNLPIDDVLNLIKTSKGSLVKDKDITNKIITASPLLSGKVGSLKEVVVRLFFKDGSTTDVGVRIRLTEGASDKFISDIKNGILKPTKEVVKQYGGYNLSDNFGVLPEGITIVEASDKINTAFTGNYEAVVDIINEYEGSIKGIRVPVEVIPLDANNVDIKTKEIVKEQGKGDEVNLTEGIEGYENLGIKKAETLISVKDDKVGNFNGKLKLTFEDNSTALVYIPVKITEKKVDFNAETQKVQIYKDHVVTNGDLRNAFTNLPANAEVIDLTSPPVDTSTIGEKNARVKVILKDGREFEYVVLLEVIDPIGELEKQIEKGNEKIKTITENNGKLNKEIENLENQIADAKNKNNELSNKIANLENEKNTLEKELENEKSRDNSDPSKIKDLEEQIKDKEKDIQNLTNGKKSLENEIAKLREEREELKKIIEELNKKLQNTPSNPNHGDKNPKIFDSNEESEISDDNATSNIIETSSNINNISEFDFGGYNYISSGYSGEYKETTKQKETTKYKESTKDESTKEYNPFYSLYSYLSIRDNKLEYVFTIGSFDYEKYINDVKESIRMDVKPYLKNDRTMLPLRYVAEAIGADVKWDNNTRTAIFTKDGIVAKMQIDGNEIKMSDGNIYQLDAKPDNINGRIFIPLTDVSKVFNLTNGHTKDGINQNIEWNNSTQTVIIRR